MGTAIKSLIYLMVITAGINGFANRCCAQERTLPGDFYKRFTGTVAGRPVMVYLYGLNGQVRGWYQYDRYKTPICLSRLKRRSAPAELVMAEGDAAGHPGKHLPEWKCIYRDGRLTGSWSNAGKTKVYRIRLKENYSGGAHAFSVFRYQHTFDAFPGVDSTPQFRITVAFPVAGQQLEAAGWLNNRVKEVMAQDTSLSFDEGLKRNLEEIVEAYRSGLENEKDGPFRASMNNETIATASVNYNEHDYVVIRSDLYTYTGGVHGVREASYTCYDVQRRKELELNGIVSAGPATLQRLIEKQFRKDNGLQPLDTLTAILFKNKLPPNDNFYFNDKGLGFSYNPYEVAAYATGIIDVLIPYRDLKKYLVPAFRQRMKIKVD